MLEDIEAPFALTHLDGIAVGGLDVKHGHGAPPVRRRERCSRKIELLEAGLARLVTGRSVGALEVLDVGVRAGIEAAHVPVVLPSNDVRRRAVGAEHLKDLAVALGFAGVVGADDDSVAGSRAEDRA
jgi:hypothetical protein